MRPFAGMKRLLIIGIIMVIAASIPTLAICLGYSNLYGGYPDPDCRKPVVPFNRDQFSVNMFNNDFEQYKRCIQDYVDAADNDRQAIVRKTTSVVDAFNRFASSIR